MNSRSLEIEEIKEINESFAARCNKSIIPGISVTTNNIVNYIINKVIYENYTSGNNMCTRSLKYSILTGWDEYIAAKILESYTVVQHEEEAGLIVSPDKIDYITFSIKSGIGTLNLNGSLERINFLNKELDEYFDTIKTTIEWVYSADGYSIKIPLDNKKLPIQEMYPFMTESLDSYYQRFIDSSASILVLIGPPGVGKTTWIRGFLSYYKKHALVTYDSDLLKKDYIFAEFLESDKHVMVIEDADSFLGARTDGNQIMHKFLNVGDGLVTVKGKKLIFSTNLPLISDIDPALVRPGRCFDVIKFNELSKDEATKLCNAMNIIMPSTEKETYNIGDIFHTQNLTSKKQEKKFGFI